MKAMKRGQRVLISPIDEHYNIICPECGNKVKTEIKEAQETYPIKGVPTTINAKIRYCCLCNKDIFDAELDNDNLRKALDKYILSKDGE